MKNRLSLIIQQEMADSPVSMIPFIRFMELALYHPTYGYYSSTKPKVGKEGDFYTSASVHPVFGETLADVVLAHVEQAGIKHPTLVEVGGGTGALMQYILTRIREVAPDRYEQLRIVMVETSPYHTDLQQQALATHTCAKEWYPTVAEAAKIEAVQGVVISNEWLDAFPVHLLDKTQSGWQEVAVRYDQANDQWSETYLAALDPQLEAYLAQLPANLPTGIRVEVNLAMQGAIGQVAQLLQKGYVITIDYGDEAEALYHPSRMRGTLMCYYRHQASDNPYERVGEQDMTAHVNFSALMKWGEEVGLTTVSLLRQDQFLIQGGILTKAQSHNDRDPFTSQAMKRNRAITQLLMSSGMGGVFRVLTQKK